MALVDDVTLFQAELQESARESDRRFRVLERELSLFMQQTMLGVIEWDAELLVREWNPAAQSIFGYSRAEALGHSSFELIIPPSAAAHVASINRQLIAGTGGVYSVNENVRKNGARITCEWFNTALTDEDGRVSGAISLVRDISEQRRAQLFMERQRALDAIMTKTLTGFATCTPEDVDGYVVLALQDLAGFVGVDHAHIIMLSDDRTSYTATHEWCGADVPTQAEAYAVVPAGTMAWTEKKLLAGSVIRINTFDDFPPEAMAERNTPDRHAGSLSLLHVPIYGGSGRVAGAIGLDSHAKETTWSDEDVAACKMVGDAIANVLERKRSESARTELARQLISAQELERSRIARELHDDIGQSLAVLGIQLQNLEPSVSGESKWPRPEISELRERVKEIGQKVSRLSHRLHSSELEFLGLAPAVEALCREFSEEYHVPVEHDCKAMPAGINPEVGLALLRVLQEALHNVAKHSQARSVRVELAGSDHQLRLYVQDDGVGFDADGPRRKPGLGLVSMRERMHLAGGSLNVTSSLGQGTKIEARAPLKVEGRASS